MSARTARKHRPFVTHVGTVYPTEQKVGEDLLQRLIVELLRPLVERWLADAGTPALTGADQFIYFRRGDVRRRVAPDVFVLPGVRPGRRIRSWKTWEEGIVPSFALEVVSSDVDKDYIEAPELYRDLGVRELVLFDPDFEDEADRYRFQLYRQRGRRGFVRAIVTNEDRVRSAVLGCWLRVTGTGATTRLRLATGAVGDALVPTQEERERAEKERERAEKERERAEKEHERAEREREHSARIAAEREVAQLKALLRARSRTKRRKKPAT
jgi:Uma2 family endonuclease